MAKNDTIEQEPSTPVSMTAKSSSNVKLKKIAKLISAIVAFIAAVLAIWMFFFRHLLLF